MSTVILAVGLVAIVLLFVTANLLLMKGNKVAKENCCEAIPKKIEMCECSETFHKITEKVNLNDVMVEICKLEGGAVNLNIAEIKEVCKVLNDYVGDDVIYDNLRFAFEDKRLEAEEFTKKEEPTDDVERVSEES